MIINTNHYHYRLRVKHCMIFLGTFLIWIGCLVSYLSSSKQKLNEKIMGKLPSWSTFIACLLLAIYSFSYHYGVVVAVLMTLLLVMAMWLFLVIFSSHKNNKVMLVSTFGFSLFSGILVLGVR